MLQFYLAQEEPAVKEYLSHSWIKRQGEYELYIIGILLLVHTV